MMFCVTVSVDARTQGTETSPTLFDPSAALYLNDSPKYEIGGCSNPFHSVLMKEPLRSSRRPEPLGSDAAN